MKITLFDIFRYLFRWKFLIAGMGILAIFMGWFYVESHQNYVAEVVIKYTNPSAQSGLTPKGTKLDVYEVISPNVVSKALNRLNLGLGVEYVRSAITISPIIPASEVEIKKAKLAEGVAYEYVPTSYTISYTMSKSEANYASYPRDILDAIINEYMIYYSDMYMNQSRVAEIQTDIQVGRNDYLEIVEVIDKKTTEILSYLSEKATVEAPEFRAPSTGLSFGDLDARYKVIKTMDLPGIFSSILNDKVALNNEVLVKKYQGRKDNYNHSAANHQEKEALAKGLMDNYIKSNQQVPNAYNGNSNGGEHEGLYTIENINGYNQKDDIRGRKTTYDTLVENYANEGIAAATDTLDADYCDQIIQIFSEPREVTGDQDAATQQVVATLNTLTKKWNDTYKLLDATIADYNRVVATQGITCLTTVNVGTTLPGKVYMALAAVVGVLLGMVLAITIEILRLLKQSTEGA